MLIGSHLKQIRENKKVTQQEVADYLGISQKTFSNIEADKSVLSTIHLFKLTEILELDILEIFKGQGLKFKTSDNDIKDITTDYINDNNVKKIIEQFESRLSIKRELIKLLKEKIIKIECEL